MRILIGQFEHESNTFSSVKTTEDSFKLWEWDHGSEIINKHKGVHDYLGGMIDRGNELAVDLIPIFSTFAYPSGYIEIKTYQNIKSQFLEAIKQEKDIDGICLALHGAAVADELDDLEGNLLQSIRNIVGPSIPIVATLDLHGNLTDKMISSCDALLGVNFYPHTDSYDRGREALNLLHEIINKTLNPVMRLIKIPILIPTLTSDLPPISEINKYCWHWEKENEVIDCTFYHGFPYTDAPEVGASVLTITNNNPSLAEKVSLSVAEVVWKKRKEFYPKLLNPVEGIRKAISLKDKPIIINETSDNPGAGTPGDGTYLLSALINEEVKDTCFAFINDIEVVNAAHKIGVGNYIDVKLGGKQDNLHGEPLLIKAYIKSLTDGEYIQSSIMDNGKKVKLGKSARLQVNGIDIIVGSLASQVMDEEIFLLHGIDVKKYKIVAIKSSQHFRSSFSAISNKFITVDSPGLSTFDLKSFNYKRINRPIYPLDKIEDFQFINKVSVLENNK